MFIFFIHSQRRFFGAYIFLGEKIELNCICVWLLWKKKTLLTFKRLILSTLKINWNTDFKLKKKNSKSWDWAVVKTEDIH